MAVNIGTARKKAALGGIRIEKNARSRSLLTSLAVWMTCLSSVCLSMSTFSEYRTILMDPPWNERGCGRIKRGADRHYPLLKPPEILAAILGSGVWRLAADCHLYCWVTNNHVPSGIWLVEALGFRYITLLTWAKDRFGLGQYFRGQTEQLIFAVRGRLPAGEKRGHLDFFPPAAAFGQAGAGLRKD